MGFFSGLSLSSVMEKGSNEAEVIEMTRIPTLLSQIVLILAILTFTGCWNPFVSDKEAPDSDIMELPEPTTPDKLFEIFDYAMDHGDIDRYEQVLDNDYWHVNPGTAGELGTVWGKSEDVRNMGDIFESFVSFEFNYERKRQCTEYGSNMNPPDGSPISEEHPDENWEVFMGSSTHLLLDEKGDGLFTKGDLEIKLREVECEGKIEWRIIRWIDYPSI